MRSSVGLTVHRDAGGICLWRLPVEGRAAWVCLGPHGTDAVRVSEEVVRAWLVQAVHFEWSEAAEPVYDKRAWRTASRYALVKFRWTEGHLHLELRDHARDELDRTARAAAGGVEPHLLSLDDDVLLKLSPPEEA